MFQKYLPTVLLALIAPLALSQAPQTPAPQPLAAMPYSPSLDLTDMDRSVDPCQNFYKYACGGWEKNNPIPADQAGWSVYAKLANDNQQFLWGILVEDAKPSPTRTPVQQKIGDYFAACMDTAAIDAKGDKPIQPALAEIDALHTRAALITFVTHLHHALPGSYFFESGTDQDAADSSVIIAELNPGGLGLPDRDYYLKTDADTVKVREKYVAYIVTLLTLSGESDAQAKADAAAILHIETELAKASLTRVQLRDPHATYNMMPVADVAKLAPAIDWPKYLLVQEGADQPGAPPAPAITRINVSEPAFMKAVQAELTTEPLDALRVYLRFHALTAAASSLSAPYRNAQFDFYSHTLRGTPAQPPRWKTCVRGVDRNLGEALGQEFVSRTFSANMKARTQLMTTQIETAMQHEIENLPWMSAATKQEALVKLHAIRNKIGYPDHWRDYSTLVIRPGDYFGNVRRASLFEDARQWHKLGKPVDLNEWGMTPATVDAYFNPQMNDINFPAGVLQPPLYDIKLDDAPNYGQTGATIGHELTHAFDDEGRQFDDKGNLRDWWTPEDAKGFEERIQCIRDQYSSYVVVDDIHINGKLTSGEDVADIGGTMLAYIAWKQETEGRTLPNVDGFTPDQRFWVGMAQWACSNERPENLRLRAATDPHSPAFARINGVVSNMPAFQKAFSCKAGQPMVHTPTCRVW